MEIQIAEWLKVFLLGIVEGVTEFLPISSTGHLILSREVLQLQESLQGTFEIFIQIGAVIAVIVYYRAELWQQVTTVRHDANVRRLWVSIIIAFIPAAVLGLLFDDFIENQLVTGDIAVFVVAGGLIVGGIMFLIAEYWGGDAMFEPQHEGNASLMEKPLTYKQALVVGFWQVLALIPGMSRSGMSILGGMVAGLNRRVATQFSFYLAIPTLGGATVYTLLKNLNELSPSDIEMLLLGTVVSGVVAWVSIDWLLRYVATNTFIAFGYYRIGVGVVIILFGVF